mgnify:CR=1 FL=1
MNGIGPELPLSRDHRFGVYSLVSSYRDEVKQNFKNLLLTSPGERIMNPDFGVGLRHFLFEPRQNSVQAIRQRIEGQVRKYMPFLKVNRIEFDNNDSPVLSITIDYEVPSINLSTSISIAS